MLRPASKTVTVVAWQGIAAAIPDAGSVVGGMETAAWTLCRGLADHTDWSPSFVARSATRRTLRTIDGVQVVPVVDRWMAMRREVSDCMSPSGRPLVRRWKPSLLWQVPLLAVSWPFRSRDPDPLQPDERLLNLPMPDVWVAMGVGRESAGVIATAAAQNRPSILMIRANQDLDERYRTDPDYVSPYGERAAHCRFAIEHATLIVCQTQRQLEMLDRHFDRRGLWLANAIDLERWQTPASDPGGEYVLWVGRYDSFHKRIPLVIEIARRCPEVPFRLIANPFNPNVERQIRESCPANVSLVDPVPFSQMPDEFARASAFLSTGSQANEGFPNVLLQAAAGGTPIVSLQDFDEFITKSGSGTVVGDEDVDAAAQAIRDTLQGRVAIDRPQVNEYLSTHFAAESISRKFAGILDGVAPR